MMTDDFFRANNFFKNNTNQKKQHVRSVIYKKNLPCSGKVKAAAIQVGTYYLKMYRTK